MGKTSLANTLESFLKSPTKSPESWSWLSENHPELLCTQVMQLYDGLSINNNEELAVEVGDHAKNVKLVKLKTFRAEEVTNRSQSAYQTTAKPESKPAVPVDNGETPSVPKKVSKRQQLKKILPSWLTGKEVSTPETLKTKSSKGPDKLSATKNDSDEEKDLSTNRLNDNKTQVQVRLVDLGGHTAMVLVIVSFDLSPIPGKILCTEEKTGVRSNQDYDDLDIRGL